jgi:hypothetical protein
MNAQRVLQDYFPVVVDDPSAFDRDWEKGYRAFAGLSASPGGLSLDLGWQRTRIERNPGLLRHEGDWDVARMDLYSAGAGYDAGRLSLKMEAGLLDFAGPGGEGRNFWLQGWNFWLDGDMLRTELLQFLDSSRMWRFRFSLEEEGVEALPGPYRLEGYLEMKANLDTGRSSSMFEVTGGKGLKAGRYLSLHVDLRYVNYSDDRWQGESGFFDAWAGLRGHLGGKGWAALGVGVAPHRFDRWYFDFTGDGREGWLLERDVFGYLFPVQEGDPLDALREAERSLSEEWGLTFEGGFAF